MKKLLFTSTFIFILASCGSPSPEEELATAEKQKEELEETLQTESVELERNKQRLEILENEISQAETSQNDENVQAYIDIAEEYSTSMVSELEALSTLLAEAGESEDLDEMNDDVDAITENINGIISTYESEVSELELNETLMRRHNSLTLAHEDFPAALDQIRNGAENGDMDALAEGIASLNGISEFY